MEQNILVDFNFLTSFSNFSDFDFLISNFKFNENFGFSIPIVGFGN